MTERFEDQYLDVLQNIEAAIVSVYHDQPELTDYSVENAIAGLFRVYQARLKERPAPKLTLNGPEQKIYDAVKETCDWRLGELQQSEEAETDDAAIALNTLDEIVACLKRIRKSVNFWTKEGGRQGYLNYIVLFLGQPPQSD